MEEGDENLIIVSAVTSKSEDVTQKGKNVTSDSQILTPGSRDVSKMKDGLVSKDMTSKGKEDGLESKDLTPVSENVTSTCKNLTFTNNNITSESHTVTLDSKTLKSVFKNLHSETKDVQSLPLVNKVISENRKVTFGEQEVAFDLVSNHVKFGTQDVKYDLESENKDVQSVITNVTPPASKNLHSDNKHVKTKNITSESKDGNNKSEKDLKLFRWAIRRDSFPLVSIRNTLLKKRNISPDNLIWRRRSTGNFAAGSAGSAGGGREVPRSAPATPLQLEPTPTPRNIKHEK